MTAAASNFEREIIRMQKGIELTKSLRDQNMASLKIFREQKAAHIKQLQEKGVDPEKPEEELDRLRKAAMQEKATANSLIPWDLLKKHFPSEDFGV